MLNHILAPLLEARLFLSSFEYIISDYKQDIKQRLFALITGGLSIIAAVVLFICLFYSVILGISYTLYHNGILTGFEAVLSGVISMVIVIFCLFVFGKSKINEAILAQTSVPKTKRVATHGDSINTLIDGFIEGLLTDSPHPPKK